MNAIELGEQITTIARAGMVPHLQQIIREQRETIERLQKALAELQADLQRTLDELTGEDDKRERDDFTDECEHGEIGRCLACMRDES